ncbi:hypothetical protein [Streptomyces beijiangensis]|uniref:Uncharacterized protein n=1 Tax=Streptomyces beijiangensis TaxID=163361 RepID=A0A939F5V6_9ACTN|nr:hypothetical protein [Streptomyces beijiangensis]MBO0512890.1 hypothetical protein [Streptomyces beijiangensis]
MSSYSLTYSTELMQNYLQAEILAPDAKFQALQAQGGTSLLFSLGTDHALYVTREVPKARSGWARSDVSTAQIRKDFAGRTGVTCKDFATAQAATATSGAAPVHLAMVLSDGTNDRLYLSLNNSDSPAAWDKAPAWTAYPFDDPDHPLAQVKIAGVLIGEATDAQYIVADVIRNPSSAQPLVFRYYIDPARAGGRAWHPHDLAIDLAPGKYSSCLGRRAGQYVDGLYTIGQVAGAPQFMYQPLYNVFNPKVAAPPSLFTLPGGRTPEAIAACRNPDNSSDLYVTSGGTLYCLAAGSQQSGTVATPLFNSPRFNGVRSLYAATAGSSVMVWGLNAGNEVFFTTCQASQVTTGALGWSVPLPILTGAEQVSPYLDRANSAGTFFAHTGQNKLTKAVKSPATGMWTFSDITLDPPSGNAPAQSFTSYTTQVRVADTVTGQPAKGVPLTVTATNVTAVRINYLHYVIGPTPIQVPTDALGTVTIVEPVDSMAGTRLSVSAGGTRAEINPMDKAFKKAVALTTPALLTGATIVRPNGTTKKLVPAGASQAALQTVATANTRLGQAYTALPAALAANRLLSPATAGPRPGITAATSLSSPASILVDAGDLFCWLGEQIGSGLQYVVQLIEDGATKLWNFVVTIAGQVYQCVLDCVEAVVAATEWLYSQLKTALGDLLDYLEFLFEWNDITRTKNVMAHLTKVYLDHQVGQILVVKGEFDHMIASMEQAIGKWAGVGGWAGLGADGSATPNTKSTPNAQHSAPGWLLAHHYQNNGATLTTVKPLPPSTPSPNPITVLIQAIQHEGAVIGDTITRLQSLAADFETRPLLDTLKKLVAILADLVLESAKTVIDALFDILYDIAKAAVKLLDTPIHIPVVSDILNSFGVPDLSFLDLACWVAAVPVTLAYKVTAGRTPFPDNADTTFLITVADYPTLLNAFQPKQAAARSTTARAEAASVAAAGSPFAISATTALAVHITGHGFCGFSALFGGALISGFEAAQETGDNPWAIPSAVLGVLGGVSGGLANAVSNYVVPNDPIDNPYVSAVATATTAVRILCKLIFSGPAQAKFATTAKLGSLAVSDGRGVGAIVDAVLVIPSLACSAYHFYELSQKPVGSPRSIAIVEETSNLTNDIARVSYAVAVNTEEIPKAVAVGVMVVANICTGGLQIAECAMI